MSDDWNEQIVSFLSKGLPLHNKGVNNWGLTQEQALTTLEELSRTGIPVLGGDIYYLEDGEWVLSYDNWYCDRESDEEGSKYVERSVKVAKNYISNYKHPISRDNLFVLVYGDA